jgi:toxin HigB-1
MIRSFADRYTKEIFESGRSRRFPGSIAKRVLRRLDYIDHADTIADLKLPKSNCLHELSDDRKGQFSISVNDQWRICFRFVNGDAFDVELTDYH